MDLGCHTGILTKALEANYLNATITATDISDKILQSFEHPNKLLFDEEEIDKLELKNLDLVTFSQGLHWINDVPSFLRGIRNILQPNGLFIANFVGGSSLRKLRTSLIEAEIATNRGHSSHISPFIHFDQVSLLLAQAGFNEIVIDYENIAIEYNSPLELMHAIKNIGENNALADTNNYSISKEMLRILSKNTGEFCDQIQLISFIAAPHKNSIKLKI